ncbi:transient receptor potential cation channel subfamily A member 1-like [Amphiura filiformis]|uniref:transient receptor potential cation channel subfamily A member 1-like n=1 Tax=Amphiura filiformis TaxID=82378 RepID=UPI003B227E39
MAKTSIDDGSILAEQYLLESPKSPKEVRFTEDIPLQVQGINFSTQKKIGPLGRKRLRSGASSIRGGKSQSFHPLEAQDEGKQLSDAKGSGRLKLKRLGFGQSRRKRYDENSNNKSPKTSIRSIFSFTRSFSWTEARPEINRLDKLDDNGLASMHIAAQSNQVAKIDELIRKEADVNVKSSVDEATPLHLAARYNCPDAAEVLLQYGADVTDALTNGQTPLHVCCRRGFSKVVKILIHNGKADVNSRDKDKTTPLHQATIKGDIDVCRLLIENGADIRAKDINQLTPLMQAAQSGFEECVQILLTMAIQGGIPLGDFLSDKDNEGNTALHLAVGNRHINVSRSLIERGAPVNCRKTTNGFTPLHQAAIIGEEPLAQMLIDKGAETEIIDKEQMTPLHRAAMFNRVDTILLLIRQGLYLETKDEDNFTPLLCAAWKDQTEAGRALLRYGADITAIDKEMKSCLHWAVEMQHLEFAKMLFEHGHGGEEILNWKDRAEQTALHYAAEVGNVEMVKLLIENGASIVVKDGEEKAPLHTACQFGHLECVQTLLQACPIPLNDDDIDDMTPLLLASANGHHRVVKFLIKMGADIASRNDDRRSPLALAARNNELRVLNALIDNNADVNAMDKDRNTALHLCAQYGHEAPTRLLLNSGADLRLQNVYGHYPLDVAIENKHEGVAKAILSCKSWEVAMNNCDATGHSPMRRLIAQLPEAALLVMNQCVTYSHEDLNHPDLKITYDYRYIDPGPDDISFDKNKMRYFALETMVEFRREKLLAHRLCQTSLSKKWKSFARYFNYFDFLVYLVFVIIVSLYLKLNVAIYNTTDKDGLGCPTLNATINETELYSLPYFDSVLFYMENENDTVYHILLWDDTTLGIQAFILMFILFRALVELIGIVRHPIAYFRRPEHLLHWSMFIPTFLFVFPPVLAPCAWHWAWGAVAVFVTWMNFIFVLNRFDFFGLYVTMFFTTLKSLLKAMSVYIFFILGFALAFFICFQSTNPAFKTEWKSIVTTFVMTLGEINKSDILDDTDVDLAPFEEVANVLMVIFLFVMPMVLINLTIGISVGDIEHILDSSYYKRFSLQTNIILRTEKGFPRWLQRRVWFPEADYWPNKRKGTLRRKAQSILGGSNTRFLRKSREETSRDVTVQDVLMEVRRNDSTIAMLSTIIQQQGNLLRRIAKKHDIKVDLEDTAALTTVPHGKKFK